MLFLGHQSTDKDADALSDNGSNDASSVYSFASSISGDAEVAVESNAIEKMQEKFSQATADAFEKSLQTRTKALQVINETLKHNVMGYTVEERQVTIIDIIDRSLRKGKGQEQALAAKMASLLVIQLELPSNRQVVVKTLAPTLQIVALDKTATPDARAKCCTSLALLQLLSPDDVGDVILLCKMFEGIFSGSYLKGDNSHSSVNADVGSLHAAAINAWGLLLTLIPSGDVVSLIETKQILASFKSLLSLLQSPHLDVRMSAGEALALLLESGRGHDEEFLDEYIPEMVESTKLLATDSQKFRAKRDRKQQRSTFRDVLLYIEEETAPEVTIQVGNGNVKEQLVLDSFAINHQYDSLCNALGSGMNIHLVENNVMRDIFELGAKLDATQAPLTKLSKNEKRAIQAASFKARTITRGKNRDKRSAVVA